MITEREVEERMRRAGEAMPVQPLTYETFILRARPRRRRFLVASATAAVVLIAGAAVGIVRIIAAEEPAGRIVDPAGIEGQLTLERVDRALRAFASNVRSEDAVGSWQALTPRAREEIGGLARWKEEMDEVAYLYDWIGRVPTDVELTKLDADTGVVVAAEREPRGSRWLLTAVGVRDARDEVLIELDLDRVVSLEPRFPSIAAGVACPPTADECPDVEDARPTIGTGDTLSVLVSPEEKVEKVWFSLGGDAWVAEASLDPADDGVLASADVQADQVPEETVLVVAIARPDGGIDAYGYRVLFES